MNYHHDQQPETERRALLRWAEEVVQLRDKFSLPYTQEDLPTLADASWKLSCLSELSQVLSEQFLFRSGPDWADSPGIDAVLDAYSKTAGHLGMAVGHYGSACSRLAFLRRHPQLPKDAGLRDACGNAFVLAQQELAETRDKLASARASLEGGASDLEDAPALSRAARARSAQAGHARCPAPADAESHTAAPAQQPPHAPGAARAR